MICKYCGELLEEGQNVCPSCGREQSEDQPSGRKKLSPAKLTLIIVAVVVLVAVLAVVVYLGVNGSFTPKENDIYYKDSYTLSGSKLSASQDKVVATLGDYSLTNRQLQVFYWMQVFDFVDYYSSYIYYFGLDITSPLDEQYYDEDSGTTWQHFFLDSALTAWRQYKMLSIEAENAGYEMPEAYQTFFDSLESSMQESADSNGYESIDAMLQAEMGEGVTYAEYLEYLRLYYVGNLYFSEVVNSLEVTDQELEDYYLENAETLESSYGVTKDSGLLVDVRHILIMPEGGTTVENEDGTTSTEYSDEEWEACREKAQEIYDLWLSGDMTEDSFAELAVEYSEDGSASDGGLLDTFGAGTMVEAFEDWCLNQTHVSGDTGLVQTEYGYHIIYYVDGEEAWILYAKSGVLNEKAVELLAEYVDKYAYEVNYKAIGFGAADLTTTS